MIKAAFSRGWKLSLALLVTVPGLSAQSFVPPTSPPPLPPEGLPPPPTDPPPALPDTSELLQQLRQLEELLEMSSDKLDRLTQTIAFIRDMPQEEREAMRIRLRQITQTTPELQQEINRLSKLLPADRQSDFSQFWLAADATEREKIRSEVSAVSRNESTVILLELVNEFAARRDAVFDSMRQRLMERGPPVPKR